MNVHCFHNLKKIDTQATFTHRTGTWHWIILFLSVDTLSGGKRDYVLKPLCLTLKSFTTKLVVRTRSESSSFWVWAVWPATSRAKRSLGWVVFLRDRITGHGARGCRAHTHWDPLPTTQGSGPRYRGPQRSELLPRPRKLGLTPKSKKQNSDSSRACSRERSVGLGVLPAKRFLREGVPSLRSSPRKGGSSPRRPGPHRS